MSQVRTQWPVEAAQPRYRQSAFVPSATSQNSQPQEVAAQSAASAAFPASHSPGGLSAQLKAHAKSSPPGEPSYAGGVAVCPLTPAGRHFWGLHLRQCSKGYAGWITEDEGS